MRGSVGRFIDGEGPLIELARASRIIASREDIRQIAGRSSSVRMPRSPCFFQNGERAPREGLRFSGFARPEQDNGEITESRADCRMNRTESALLYPQSAAQ